MTKGSETSFGFFKANIRNWLVEECKQSGQHPEHFWWALQEVFHELEEEIDDSFDFWGDEEEETDE
jgi:hypothetical protein